MKQLRGVCVHEAVCFWCFGVLVFWCGSVLLLDQLDDEDNEAGSDNAADDVADDSLDDEAACEPAEERTAYKSDEDVDIPGERTLHDDSCKPAANACNNK